MRVALVCSEKLPVPAVRGGAIQQYIEGIVPFLREKHQVTVFSIEDASLHKTEIRDQVEYCRIRAIDKHKKEYAKKVTQELAQRQFDLVHIFNRPAAFESYFSASPQSKFVLSLHNEMFAPNKINPAQAEFCLKNCSALFTVSDYINETITQQYPIAQGKVHTIYSGVDPTAYKPIWSSEAQEIKAKIQREYGIGNGKIVLAVTRFSKKKGVHIILQAMKQVLQRHPEVILLIVGSKWYGNNKVDGYVSYVHRLAKELPENHVIFTGFVPPKQVADFYSAGDLFVCASQWQEPLARIHYEAMAAGLPIITTNRGGNAEVITGQGNGIIVSDYQSSSGFAESINYLLENPQFADSLGRKGRELAVEKYNWARVAGEILAIYEQIGINP